MLLKENRALTRIVPLAWSMCVNGASVEAQFCDGPLGLLSDNVLVMFEVTAGR